MRDVVIVTGIIGVILALMRLQKWQPCLRQIASGLLISYWTTLLLLGSIELAMRCCYLESDNLPTLAQANWWSRHMQMNSLGFRDRDWKVDEFADQTVIAAVGDSFIVGYGINDVQDRITEQLAAHLSEDCTVVNLGISGSSTATQIEALHTFTAQLVPPDVVIWQYFLNDIEYTGTQLGITPILPPVPPLAQESYLANFLHWRLAPPAQIVMTDGTTWTNWWDWLYAAYDNPGIWAVHQQDFAAMVEEVEAIGAELIVLIYPNLTDIIHSIPYVDRVEQALIAQGVAPDQIVKLFDAAAGWSPSELTVSRRDLHPSASFNQYVADLLYTRFFASQSTKVDAQ